VRDTAGAARALGRVLPQGRAATIGAWLAILVAAVVLLRPFRAPDNEGAIALALLLPPLVATGAGPVVAGAAALVTGLAFNFFFTQPYDSPRIESPSSVAAFVVYLVVAVLVAGAVARTRAAWTVADRRARDATLLQSVTVELIRNAQLVPTLRSALAELVDALALRGACLRVTLDEEPVDVAAGIADRCEETARRVLGTAGPTPAVVALRAVGAAAAFPLTAGSGPLGVLVVDVGDGSLRGDRERILESFAGIVALAVERARLSSEGLRRRALEETDRLRTTLVQSVSHDLRTPLTAIRATASALREGEIEETARDAMLGDIEDAAERLGRLVSNLLDLSRIETGALTVHREQVPLDELLLDAVQATSLGAAGEERVALHLPDDDVLLDVDETLVRQVLVNLLDNATRLDPDGTIAVSARATDTVAEIRVVDHGPGIAEEERHRLFEPYHRRRPGARAGGTGLGLVISRGFVEANGGTLRVEPTPGGGATFILELPVRR
jgi:two-component system sensor histidine kinase KdpD